MWCWNRAKFVAPLLLLPFGHAALAQQPPVTVKTYGQHLGGNIVYHYEVTNNGGRNVVDIEIGHDTDQTSPNTPATRDGGELNFVMPVGSGITNLAINPASVFAPPRWKAEIVQIEDSGRFLQWRSPGYPHLGIQPGQTFRFSVTVPTYVAGYLTGHFSAGYADGKDPWYVNGAIEKLDVTAPALTITLTPSTIWPPTEKLVPISATVTVKDDYDPQPEVKLESITCNEPLASGDMQGAQLGADVRQFRLKATRAANNLSGRTYTVTYSATDGSGNKSTASAIVGVPRDQH